MQSCADLPCVHFLPLQPEICELLNSADLHVLPQSRGAADLVLPSKLGGMLASGKPVLATADAGTELFEVLSGTAILVPAGDSVAMAHEIGILGCRGRASGARRWAEARLNSSTGKPASRNFARFSTGAPAKGLELPPRSCDGKTPGRIRDPAAGARAAAPHSAAPATGRRT